MRRWRDIPQSRRRTALSCFIAACLFVAPGASDAAAQISLTLPVLVQITGLSDVTFANVGVSTAATSSQNDCVWTNTLSRTYTVTATGNGAGGTAFTIANSGGKTTPYGVTWAGTANAGSGTALNANVTSPVFTSAALVPTCSVGAASSSTLTVTIAASDLQGMIAGSSYTGALTLVISPQ